jgi:hypothetical protein
MLPQKLAEQAAEAMEELDAALLEAALTNILIY